MYKTLLLIALLSSNFIFLSIQANAEVGKEILVELNNQWYPAKIAEEKENAGVKAYRITYSASGGQEWVAPNRVLLDPKASKPVVGESKPTPETFAVGTSVSIEYNGGWYPATMNEIGNLAGLTIYKITYAQSGLIEWVAPNRIRKSA